MSDTHWQVRAAREDDADLLKSFHCAAQDHHWQREVERFIHDDLTAWAFDPHAVSGDPRLLLLTDRSDQLIGVAAHEQAAP